MLLVVVDVVDVVVPRALFLSLCSPASCWSFALDWMFDQDSRCVTQTQSSQIVPPRPTQPSILVNKDLPCVVLYPTTCDVPNNHPIDCQSVMSVLEVGMRVGQTTMGNRR